MLTLRLQTVHVSQIVYFQEGTCCALVLIEMQSALSDKLCPLRFLSLWTDGSLSFDVEPKYRRSFLFGGVLPPYNVFLTISYTLWTICQVRSCFNQVRKRAEKCDRFGPICK